MNEGAVLVELKESEIRYIVACGFALIQNVPPDSLPTYSTFTKDQILEFSRKMRRIMDENGLDM